MEQLFMQVFERRDWVAAQVDQQADSYSQTLACTLLANGYRPPDWLLPNPAAGPQQKLNGKPIVPGLLFTGSQITTPAANRNVFFPAIPSTSIRNSEILNAYTQPVNNCGTLSTLATDKHEEPQQEQTSLSKELANCCDGANMFSRIQRSKSRQRNIEDSRRGSGQAANSGTCDGIQAVGPNKATVSSSSRSCGDAANNAETTSSCPGQANGLHASQGRSTDLLKHHNNLGSQGNQLDCLSSLDLKDKIMCSDNNYSARDSQIVPLPKHSELNIADTMCHAMPGTHPLVEPKKLQFDGAESFCMGNTSEQTEPQHESALESDNFGLADRNLLREDPYTASSSQEPHSMGRPSLDGLKSDYLKFVNADLKHNHYGLESGHRDLSPMHSPNEEQSLNCSAEVPSFVADSLLRTNTLYVLETSSKLGQTQEMGSLNSDQTKCSGRSHSVVNSLLEKDIFQTVEDTNNPERSNPKVSVPPSNGPLQLPIQLADASFEANISSRMSMNSLLGENGHNHLSNLLTDSNSRCLLGVSSVSLVQFPPQKFTSNNVCQSSPFAAADAFESAENICDADAPLGQPTPVMHNEMLIENPASEMVDCYSGKLSDDVHVNEAHDCSTGNKKDQFVAPKVYIQCFIRKNKKDARDKEQCDSFRKMQWKPTARRYPGCLCCLSCKFSFVANITVAYSYITSNLSGMEQEVPTADNDVPINAEACTVENVELIKSSRPSVQYYLRSSVSYEKKNQLQANRKNGQKRSVADGVQVNGGTSSKTKRMKCQDVTHSHSTRTNSLCLNNQDSIGSHVGTAENLSGRSQPSGRYLLRSSGFSEFISLESQTKNAATNSKMSVASDVPENGDASQKPMKNNHLSDFAIYNSSSGEALSSRFSCSNGSRSAVEGMDFPNPQAQFETNFDVAATSALPSCSNIRPDIGECYAQESIDYFSPLFGRKNNCLEGLGSSVNVSSVKYQKMPIQTDENLILLNQEYYSGTGSLTMLPSHVLDQHGKQTSGLVASADKKLNFDSGVKLDTRCENEDSARILLTDATILRQGGDNSVDCNVILPEFECFNVSLPLDSTTTEKRVYETLCAPIRFGTLSSDISSKYKVNTVGGMHQLVATMPKNATSCSSSGDVRQYSDSVSSDDNMSITDIFGSCGLGTSGSFVPSASCSSNGSDKHVSGDNPLTPAVEKYSMGKLSARVGSVSEHMGLIPELSCFRIDEDADNGEENECQDMLSEFVANQLQSDRIALQDITGLYHNTEKADATDQT
ncbi:hypothetical protein PR202_gb22318 [Eleusine coracana subsp. coracana]|uniref:Uncharacterized protein n=1 Tax=Eleusine coracana subsp. coracana TaxID=191504 RepID=A0AAV5FGA2_ELECO|nr:hypothetical protein PR202_gb22318 [Eleusine coracana subsp. coracana]